MGVSFSDSINESGIVEQARTKAICDSTQWSTKKITNSCNHWLNHIFTYGKKVDKQFQIDDFNHTALPEGTSQLTINVCDYSFLTDQQGNKITNLTSVSILTNGKYQPLTLIDRNDPDYDAPNFGTVSGIPSKYDKIADNIIRLDKLPSATVAAGLKYTFQRSPSYFVATDTTKQPGVADDLHEGFIAKAAYDAAYTLGLPSLGDCRLELEKQEKVMSDYFASRNTDKKGRLKSAVEDNH